MPIEHFCGYAFENGEPTELQTKKLAGSQISNGDKATGYCYREGNELWFRVVDANGNEYDTQERPYINTGITLWRATDADLARAKTNPTTEIELRLRRVLDAMNDHRPTYAKLAYLSGRRANGASRDAGPLVHAVTQWFDHGDNMAPAICGAQPGLRSAGWTESAHATAPTCPKCLKKLGA